MSIVCDFRVLVATVGVWKKWNLRFGKVWKKYGIFFSVAAADPAQSAPIGACLSVCPHCMQGACVSVCPLGACLSVCPLGACLSVCPLGACLSVCPLGDCLSVYPVQTCFSVGPLGDCLSVYLVQTCFSVCPAGSCLCDLGAVASRCVRHTGVQWYPQLSRPNKKKKKRAVGPLGQLAMC